MTPTVPAVRRSPRRCCAEPTRATHSSVSTVAVAQATAAAPPRIELPRVTCPRPFPTPWSFPAGLMVRDAQRQGIPAHRHAHIVDCAGAHRYFQPLGGGAFVDASARLPCSTPADIPADDGAPRSSPSWTATSTCRGVDRLRARQTGEVKAGLAWSSHHFLDPVPSWLPWIPRHRLRGSASQWTPARDGIPHAGISFNLGYDRRLTAWGSSSFRELSLDADVRIPLFSGLVAGLSFSGGTDFTASSASANALDPSTSSASGPIRSSGVPGLGRRWFSQARGGARPSVRLPAVPAARQLGFYILGNVSAGNCWA